MEARVAGLAKTSPADVRLCVDECRTKRRSRWRSLLVAPGRRPPDVLDGKTRFVLALGTSSLGACAKTLESRTGRAQLSVLVADCESSLEEAGAPILDGAGPLDDRGLESWIFDGEGESVPLGGIDFSLCSPSASVSRKLEEGGKSVSGLLLDMTLAVASKKAKASMRRALLSWLGDPKADEEALSSSLSPYVSVDKIAKHISLLASSEFKPAKKKCERLVAFLRKGPDEPAVVKWTERNCKDGVLASFDARYLESVFNAVA